MFDRLVLIGAGKTSGAIVDRLSRIAPLTVVDRSAAALEALSSYAAEGVHPVTAHEADGTSRLVLLDLRGDPKTSVGLVVTTGDDRAALEACRLGADLGYAPVIAVVNDRAVAQQCEHVGARALVRVEIVGQLVEQSLARMGLGVISAGGSGRGELLEFTVQPSSPAIGVPLAELRAEGWRVAAIYRGDALVLPTGGTTIAADDRVVVVGDPAQLPHVAESLRVGVPTFPLLHGPNVVVYLPAGRDGDVETEAELLTARTRAAKLVRVQPHVEESQSAVDIRLPDGRSRTTRVDVVAVDDGATVERHLPIVRAKQPGVIVTRLPPRTAVDVLLGLGGVAARLCNAVNVPVLFPRGSSHHDRVVLCLTDGDVDLVICEIALDLARLFEVPLEVLRAKLPSYLQPADETTERLIDTFTRRARLHGLVPEMRELEGNPIVEWGKASAPGDLAVVGRARSERDSFSRPDLALRFAQRSRGSVLVVTRADRTTTA